MRHIRDHLKIFNSNPVIKIDRLYGGKGVFMPNTKKALVKKIKEFETESEVRATKENELHDIINNLQLKFLFESL